MGQLGSGIGPDKIYCTKKESVKHVGWVVRLVVEEVTHNKIRWDRQPQFKKQQNV